MIRSSSSADQDRSKEDVKKGEPEQELEVTTPWFVSDIHDLVINSVTT